MIPLSRARIRLRGISGATAQATSTGSSRLGGRPFACPEVHPCLGCSLPSDTSTDSWPYCGHDADGMRYSPLTQINQDELTASRAASHFERQSGRAPTAGMSSTVMVRATRLLSFRVMCTWLLPPSMSPIPTMYTPGVKRDSSVIPFVLCRGSQTSPLFPGCWASGRPTNWLKTSISMRGNSLRVWHNLHHEFSFARPVKLAKKDSLPSSER